MEIFTSMLLVVKVAQGPPTWYWEESKRELITPTMLEQTDALVVLNWLAPDWNGRSPHATKPYRVWYKSKATETWTSAKDLLEGDIGIELLKDKDTGGTVDGVDVAALAADGTLDYVQAGVSYWSFLASDSDFAWLRQELAGRVPPPFEVTSMGMPGRPEGNCTGQGPDALTAPPPGPVHPAPPPATTRPPARRAPGATHATQHGHTAHHARQE